ncbi:hypothetical protein L0Y65_03210 [Candidatus Micrarchaeota archaeon]|nr:hypothetical protein [Candidatus Micrarchaeota archaeon]
MKATEMDRFSVPDVQDAEPIEAIVARMRKSVSSECSGLLRRSKAACAVYPAAGRPRARAWEGRISRIIEANASTFSIDELKGLLRECQDLSVEISRFEA